MNKAITIFTFAFILLSVAGYGQEFINAKDKNGVERVCFIERDSDSEIDEICWKHTGGRRVYSGPVEEYGPYEEVNNELWDKYYDAYTIKRVIDGWEIETDDCFIRPEFVVFFDQDASVHIPVKISYYYFLNNPDVDTLAYHGYVYRAAWYNPYDYDYDAWVKSLSFEPDYNFVVIVKRYTDKEDYRVRKALNKMMDILTVPFKKRMPQSYNDENGSQGKHLTDADGNEWLDITDDVRKGEKYLYLFKDHETTIKDANGRERTYYKEAFIRDADGNVFMRPIKPGEKVNVPDGFEQYQYNEFRKLLPKRSTLVYGGKEKNTKLDSRLRTFVSIPDLDRTVYEIAKTYEISPNLLLHILIIEGFFDQVAAEHDRLPTTEQDEFLSEIMEDNDNKFGDLFNEYTSSLLDFVLFHKVKATNH